MIQEVLEILNMLIVDVMPEIKNLADAVRLSDEARYFIELIRCVALGHRVLVIDKRVAYRIQNWKGSEQSSDKK